MTIHRVLVLGAAADQGLPLIDALLAKGFAPVAGVRRADAMAGTRHASLSVVHADIDDEGSLVAAMSGVDALASRLPFEFDRAKTAGCGPEALTGHELAERCAGQAHRVSKPVTRALCCRHERTGQRFLRCAATQYLRWNGEVLQLIQRARRVAAGRPSFARNATSADHAYQRGAMGKVPALDITITGESVTERL